jgi:enterochelin esterase-like enzyme
MVPPNESDLRVNKSEKTISGFSLGALFFLYTLFHNPEMFNGYIACSPTFWWDNEILFKYEQKYFGAHRCGSLSRIKNKDLTVPFFMLSRRIRSRDGHLDN